MGPALELGAAILRWIWGHKAWALVIALGVYCAWLRWDNSSLTVLANTADERIAAKQSLVDSANHERDIWKASYEGAAAALKDLRGQVDAQDAKAKAQQEQADKAVATLATQRAADQAELASFRDQIEMESHAPDANPAAVARSVLERLRQ